MSRHGPSFETRHRRAARALGGSVVAERAEQLRARGLATTRVAALLAVPADALAAYYRLQDETAGAA
jgi:hypothetical protein